LSARPALLLSHLRCPLQVFEIKKYFSCEHKPPSFATDFPVTSDAVLRAFASGIARKAAKMPKEVSQDHQSRGASEATLTIRK